MQDQGLLLNMDVMLNLMKDHFLRDLISRPVNSTTSLKETLASLNLNAYFNFPAIALLDAGMNPGIKHEKTIYMERMRDFLVERLPQGNVVFMDKEGRIGLLFSWVSKNVFESICRMLSEEFTFPVNIGVGNPYRHLSEVHASYGQAAAALENQFYSGRGKIIYFSELSNYQSLKGYPMVKEKELFEAVKAADSEAEIEAAVDIFYGSVMEGGPIDIDNVYDLTVRLLIGLEKRMLSDSDNALSYKPFETMTIIKLVSLIELKQYVTAFITGLREVVSLNGKDSHRSIIKKTLQYMELDCSNITLYSAAKKVYMTPTYLSLLFKMNTGKTFIDHLTDIRIENAKKMLKRTLLKNYEVAEQVGYKDSRYFSQIFKKKVGVSPSEYREAVTD